MWNKSIYVIEVLKDKHVIYSLITGKIVELDDREYINIFKNADFLSNRKKVELLRKAAILVQPDDFQKMFEEKRKAALDYNNALPITNYVIAPTMDCNARCSYCFEQGTHKDKMSLSIADSVVDFILENCKGHMVTIHWFGGEPLLATDVIDYISEMLNKKRVDFISKVTTNGYFLSQSIIDKSKNNWNTKSIQITVDDIGESYNEIKNYVDANDDPFSLIMANIQNALDNSLKVRIRINYEPENISKVDQIINYTQERFNAHSNLTYHPQAIFSDDVKPLSNVSFSNDKHPFLTVIDYERKFDRKHFFNSNNLEPVKSEKFKPWCNPRILKKKDFATEILCKHMLYPIEINCLGVCDDSVAVDSHGDIFVCQRMLGQTSCHSSGNVSTGFVKNETYNYFQNVKLDKQCVNCKMVPVCQGGCKFKKLMYKKQHSCLPIKRIPEQALEHALAEISEKFGNYDILLQK